MILHLDMYEEFGSFCGSGDDARRFRHERIDPYLALATQIDLDFEGVTNANSSFCNALVTNLISQNSAEILQRIRFLNCAPNLRVMLRGSVDLGLAQLDLRATHPA